MIKLKRLFVSCAAVAGLCGTLSADIKMPAIFSDHMILQQGRDLPVWGWADPGEKVSVSIAGQYKDTVAGSDGKWKITLDKIESKEALTLDIKGKNSISIKDILMGDVWLCSGQSNMQMGLSITKNASEARATATSPEIRLFALVQTPQLSPQEDCSGKWEICEPANVGRFSAAAFFFGREVHNKTKIPIGLIDSSLGGTIVEAWTSVEAQSKLPEYKIIDANAEIQRSKKWDEKAEIALYEKRMAAWNIESEKAKAENKPVPRKPREPQHPTLHKCLPGNLFNSMINPLIPFAIKGVIWYQGESNAYLQHANLYSLQLTAMINDWRTRWGYDFPFAWVQLPEYMPKSDLAVAYWPLIREEQAKCLSIPNTGMAVTLGLGEADNVHPKNKEDVGKRLALWALANVYGYKDIVYQGPAFSDFKVNGNEVAVSFKNTDGGLKAKGGKVKGFVIAGEDKKWFSANGKIDGDKIIVFTPEVPKPVAVRYAWGANPEWSITNGADLPASPFRTDDWGIKVDAEK